MQILLISSSDVVFLIQQFMICAGVSVAFIIGTVLTWRVLALTGEILYSATLCIWLYKEKWDPTMTESSLVGYLQDSSHVAF